jgi:hypothetical protein
LKFNTIFINRKEESAMRINITNNNLDSFDFSLFGFVDICLWFYKSNNKFKKDVSKCLERYFNIKTIKKYQIYTEQHVDYVIDYNHKNILSFSTTNEDINSKTITSIIDIIKFLNKDLNGNIYLTFYKKEKDMEDKTLLESQVLDLIKEENIHIFYL